MRIKEFTGKTTQEAIDNGLAELGVTIADVHVDVLQEGAKGLFGLFGSKPACVRLTVMEDEREDDHGLSDLLGSFSLNEQKKKSAPKPAAPKAEAPKPEAKPDAPKAEAAKAEAPVVQPKVETIDLSKVEIEPLFKDYVDFETFSKSDFRAVKVKSCEAVKKSKKLLKFVLDDGTGTDRIILSGIHEYYEPEELVGKTCVAITNLPPRPMMGIDSCGMLISAVHHEEGVEKLHLLMLDPHIPAGAKMY